MQKKSSKEFRLSTDNKQQGTTKETKPAKRKKRIKTAAVLQTVNFVLSLAIIATIILVVFYSQQKLKHFNTVIEGQQLKLEQVLAKQRQRAQKLNEQLTISTLAQKKELNTLKETIAAFLKQNKHSKQDWLITEAEYLLKLANHRLILAHDIDTAVQALQSADSRLHEVGNPKFIPLRKAIALDIQQLNAVKRIDIVGISAQLNALQQQTETLPLMMPDPQTIRQRKTEASSVSRVDNWQQLPAAMWQDLLKLFRIQKHNDVIKPLLMPEQRFFLIQNLKLQLEQARLALLNNQSTIYKDRIQQAQQWIKKYFDNQHPLSQAMNDSLTKLAAIDITLTLPDISASLTNLRLLQTEKIKSKVRAANKSAAKKTEPENPEPALPSNKKKNNASKSAVKL